VVLRVLSSVALNAGSLFPIGKQFAFDDYYEHQSFTVARPNQQLNQLAMRISAAGVRIALLVKRASIYSQMQG